MYQPDDKVDDVVVEQAQVAQTTEASIIKVYRCDLWLIMLVVYYSLIKSIFYKCFIILNGLNLMITQYNKVDTEKHK